MLRMDGKERDKIGDGLSYLLRTYVLCTVHVHVAIGMRWRVDAWRGSAHVPGVGDVNGRGGFCCHCTADCRAVPAPASPNPALLWRAACVRTRRWALREERRGHVEEERSPG